VVIRSPTVFVGAYGREVRVEAIAEVEEAWVGGIREDRWEIAIAFTELPKTERADVARTNDPSVADLSTDREVDITGLGIMQVVGNRSNAAELGANLGNERCERVRGRRVGEKCQHRWIGDRDSEQRDPVEVEGVQRDVHESQLCDFAESSADDRLAIRAVSQTQPRLNIVVIG